MSLRNSEIPVASITTQLLQDSKNLAAHHKHIREMTSTVDSARKPHNQYSFMKYKPKRREIEAERNAQIVRENDSLVTRLLYHANRNEWTDRLFAEADFAKDHPKTLNRPLKIEEARLINLENKRMMHRLQERSSKSEYSQDKCRPKFLHPRHLFKDKNRTALPRLHREKMRTLNVSSIGSTPKVHTLTLKMNRVKSKIDNRRPRTEIPRARSSLKELLNEFSIMYSEDLAPFLKSQPATAEMQRVVINQNRNATYSDHSQTYSEAIPEVTEEDDQSNSLDVEHMSADTDAALIYDLESGSISSFIQAHRNPNQHSQLVQSSSMGLATQENGRCKSAPAGKGKSLLKVAEIQKAESVQNHEGLDRRQSAPCKRTTYRKCLCCGERETDQPQFCRLCSKELIPRVDQSRLKEAITGSGYQRKRDPTKVTAVDVQDYYHSAVPTRPKTYSASLGSRPGSSFRLSRESSNAHPRIPSRPSTASHEKSTGPLRPNSRLKYGKWLKQDHNCNYGKGYTM